MVALVPPTQADIDRIHAAYGEFNARFEQLKEGDLSGLEDYCAPDIVLIPVDGWPVSGRFEGLDGYRRWLHEVYADTAEDRMGGIAARGGGDYVVTPMMTRGRTEGDPIEMEAPVGAIHSVRDGRLARV